MNHRTLSAGLLTAAVAVSGLAATTGSAQAVPERAGYGVTIKVSGDQPELKDRITVKGAVTPAAPGKPVLLQVRYDGQKQWKSVGRTKLNQAGKYRFTEKLKTVRERTYRVVKPATGNRTRSVSPKQDVTVFAWRDLASIQGVNYTGIFQTNRVTMGGVEYRNSLVENPAYAAPTRAVDYNLNRDCTELTGTAGLSDASPSAGTSTVAITADGVSRFSQTFALTQSAPVTVDLTGVFRLTVSATSANGGLGALGTPQVYCSF